jgi:hypothetical protein
VLTGTEPANVVASLTSVTSDFGLDSAKKWLDGAVGGDLGSAMDMVARGAQLGTDMVSTKLTSMLGGASDLLGGVAPSISSLFAGTTTVKTITPPVAVQTVNRAGVDSAVQSLIGSAKVPAPNFTGIVSPDKLQLPALSGPIDPEFLKGAGASLLGNLQGALGGIDVSALQTGNLSSLATEASNTASSLLKSQNLPQVNSSTIGTFTGKLI